MEPHTFYGMVVFIAIFLSVAFALVIPPILANSGKKYKKYIKFIAPLSPVVLLAAVTLRIFLEEAQWGITNQPPYFTCSVGVSLLIFFMIVIYFGGMLFVEFCERK